MSIAIIILFFVLQTFSLAAEEMIKHIHLDQYQWKNRVILIFAKDSENKVLSQQLEELKKHNAGLKERDIIVIKTKSWSEELIEKYQLETGYSLFLIGKDGSVKLKKSNFVSAKVLFDLIDSMPMRKLEMQNK